MMTTRVEVRTSSFEGQFTFLSSARDSFRKLIIFLKTRSSTSRNNLHRRQKNKENPCRPERPWKTIWIEVRQRFWNEAFLRQSNLEPLLVHSNIGNLVLRGRSEFSGSALRNQKAPNPKHEIRNPKQYQMTKIQMIETIATAEIVNKDLFWSFKNFRFVSNFDIRPALARSMS